jgi:hypothetical protein
MSRRRPGRAGHALLFGVATLWLFARATWAQPGVESQNAIKAVAEETPVPADFVRFTNGDVLSGEVEEIAGGAVTMMSEMAEKRLTIPVAAVKEIVFKDANEQNPLAADHLLLVNGEALSGGIEGMTGGKVTLSMPSSQRVEVDGKNVAAMAFYRAGEVLVEESFDSRLPEKIRLEGGQWRTRDGWLLQADSRAAECFASLPVTQTGKMTYEWCVNTTIGRSTGMYFMASDPGLSQQNAYLVRILRKYVYVFFCMNGEEIYYGSYAISLHRSRNTVRLSYDSGRGKIEMWIDGTEVGRWRSPNPIRLGKYVVLRADGRAAFDDLRITRTGGAPHVEAIADQGGRDALSLINGDEIAGNVTGVSQRSVSFSVNGSEELNDISREKLLSIRWRRKLQKLPRAVGGVAVLVTRNGDRLSGELLSLRNGTARMRSELAGVVDFRRDDVKQVIFREFP